MEKPNTTSAPVAPPNNCPACNAPISRTWKSASGLSDFVRYECGLEMHNKAMVKEWRVEWGCVIHRQEWGIVMSTLRAERDAALARAEKAEGERDYARTHGQCVYCGDIHTTETIAEHIIECIKHPIGELARKFESEKDALVSELTAASARLAELQAVCDAAQELDVIGREFSDALYEAMRPYKRNIEWGRAWEKLHRALAALASGAESETK